MPFVLFVLRQMPCAETGFSPFDLVFGYRVRTPMDALYHGLYELDPRNLNVTERVMGVAERLETVRDAAFLRASKTRGGRLAQMNRGAKLRNFQVGDLVLYRIPGLSSKLEDSWEGPYVIQEVLGEVSGAC